MRKRKNISFPFFTSSHLFSLVGKYFCPFFLGFFFLLYYGVMLPAIMTAGDDHDTRIDDGNGDWLVGMILVG